MEKEKNAKNRQLRPNVFVIFISYLLHDSITNCEDQTGNVKITNGFDSLTIISMLEYFKTILSKVSFDKRLFEKELKKAIKALVPSEVVLLKEWCYGHYEQEHQPILQLCFAGY